MEAILTAISEQCFDQGFRLHRKEDCVQNLLYYFQCVVLRQTSSGFEVSDLLGMLMPVGRHKIQPRSIRLLRFWGTAKLSRKWREIAKIRITYKVIVQHCLEAQRFIPTVSRKNNGKLNGLINSRQNDLRHWI